MSMDYIRKTYRVPAKRGMWVRFNEPGQHHWMTGVIKSARHGCLRVCFDVYGRTNRSIVHPLDLDYRVDCEWWRPPQSRERIALKEMELDAEMWEGIEVLP